MKDYEQREYFGLFSFFQRTEFVKRGDGSYVLGEKADGDATFESVFAKGPKYAARPALPGGEEQLDWPAAAGNSSPSRCPATTGISIATSPTASGR